MGSANAWLGACAPAVWSQPARGALGRTHGQRIKCAPSGDVERPIAMRLKDYQVKAIKDAAQRCFGPNARVYLFGSRTDDTRRGGDIDLYIESDTPIPDRSRRQRRFEMDLLKALGERRIDIVLWDPEITTQGIHRRAKETGVELT